jgi:predicted GIY-YIG superfamily endonuclease
LHLEEFGLKIVHIKGIHNTVADAISSFGPVQDEKADWMSFTECWCHYTMHAPTEESTHTHQHQINMVFSNCSKKDIIYPLTVQEIAQAQKDESVLKKLSKTDKCSTQLVEDTQVLYKDSKMVIPNVQHPGHTHFEETLQTAMYYKGMRNTI